MACGELGIDVVGIEIEPVVCQTRRMAGWRTVEADVSKVDPQDYPCDLLIASPPCQSFSRAGKQQGQLDKEFILRTIERGEWDSRLVASFAWHDERSRLVLEPMRWVEELLPEYIAMEQVPSVKPLWESLAKHWTRVGYSCVTGVVNAADYGVPQVRKRAILIARWDGKPVDFLQPTHGPGGTRPWRTMADALGWTATKHPSPELQGKGRRTPGMTGTTVKAQQAWWKPWAHERPSTTIASRALAPDPGENANRFNQSVKTRNDGIKLTDQDGLILQTFPPEYPLQGNRAQRWEQIGNAIPPRLAQAMLRAVLKEDNPCG